MKNYWEIEPSEVQVKIKNKEHLDELFKMCELFGLEIDVDDYKPGYRYFRKNVKETWHANYRYNEHFAVVNTELFYEILCHNYGYQGGIEGFDKDVVIKMLHYQEEQVKKRDIKVFEKNPELSDTAAGFDWDKTIEGADFWDETIFGNKGKFPEKQHETSQELETETQSKEVDRLNSDIEVLISEVKTLKFKNSELERRHARLTNINKEMNKEITNIEYSFKKLEKKNKKLKKLVRYFIKK